MRSQTARTIVRILAVLLCAVGIVLSVHLLEKHWKIDRAAKSADDGGLMSLLDRGCTTIIPEADCDKVVASRWGKIGDVPTALLGLYYFTGLFWWFLLIGGVTLSRKAIHLLVTAVMAAGLGFSIFLTWQMSREGWCTWCLFSHGANLLVFLCMLLLWPRRPRVVAVSAPRSRKAAEGLFKESSGVAYLEQEWPSGWALLVLPIIVLLSFALETFAFQPRGDAALAGLVQAAQREAEMYRRMAAGEDVTGEMQEQLGALQEALQRAVAESKTEIARKDSELKSKQEQIEALQKLAAGKPVAQEMEKLQKDLKIAQDYRNYYEREYKRYNDRWQHTHMAWAISPPVKISMDKARVMGPADAKHTLTVYSDYQCPTCKQFEDTLKTRIIPLAQQYGGLKVVFKMWPISTKCNSGASTDLHPAACDAALAAQAALMLGGNTAFWKMHDLLFARQSEWKRTREQVEGGMAPPDFVPYARQLGLDVEAFKKAMQSPEALAAVKADIEEGMSLGKDLLDQGFITEAEQKVIAVDSTPSVFIDNKRLSSMSHINTWRKILQEPVPDWKPEVRRAPATRPAAGGSNPQTLIPQPTR